MADILQPLHIQQRDAAVGAADQPFLLHLPDHPVHMHRRQADGIADFLLRQLQLETVLDVVVGDAQPVEHVQQERGDPRLGRCAA